MDIPTTLVLLVVLLMAGAYIAQPFAGGGDDSGGRRGHSAAALREHARLLAERNKLYATLRDLDFDYQTAKVAETDYVAARKQLVSAGVEILQKLDHQPAAYPSAQDDPIEAAVLAARRGQDTVTTESSSRNVKATRKKNR